MTATFQKSQYPSQKLRSSSDGKTWKVFAGGAFAIFLAVLYNEFILEADSPIVTLKSKLQLQGTIGYSREGRSFYQFHGIPYAASPVGKLRFEPPQPPKPWKGVLMAKKEGPICVQTEIMATGRILGVEDCLHLSVYTPKLDPKKLLPVMFYIYGGLFMAGNIDYYKGGYFMDEDVVLVVVSYRLAAMGFLNTGDDVVRGNMGLKDQNLALKWVKENIQAFGGNPSQVTIFGESAGGASVHYHMLSSQSKGLFQQAISQSGTAIFKWVLNPSSPYNQSRAMARHFNCPTEDSQELVDCLRELPAKKLVSYHREVMNPLRTTLDAFIPTIETTVHEDTFLPTHPLELMKNGNFMKIPWMSGVTSEEGLYLISRLLLNSSVAENIGPQWSQLAPSLLNYRADGNEEASQKIRERYFGKDTEIDPQKMFASFGRMFSEYWFFVEFDRSVRLHLKHAPAYLYLFSYKSRVSLLPLFQIASPEDYIACELKLAYEMIKDIFKTYVLGIQREIPGASHADDVIMQFPFHPLLHVGKSHESYRLSREMVRTWAAFASQSSTTAKTPLTYYGKTWPMMQPGESTLKYMNINEPAQVIDDPFSHDIVKFWRSLNLTYDLPPGVELLHNSIF